MIPFAAKKIIIIKTPLQIENRKQAAAVTQSDQNGAAMPGRGAVLLTDLLIIDWPASIGQEAVDQIPIR